MNLKSRELSGRSGDLETITAVIYLPRILQVLRLNDILKFIVEIIEIGNLKWRLLECLHERKKEEKKRLVRSRSQGEKEVRCRVSTYCKKFTNKQIVNNKIGSQSYRAAKLE